MSIGILFAVMLRFSHIFSKYWRSTSSVIQPFRLENIKQFFACFLINSPDWASLVLNINIGGSIKSLDRIANRTVILILTPSVALNTYFLNCSKVIGAANCHVKLDWGLIKISKQKYLICSRLNISYLKLLRICQVHSDVYARLNTELFTTWLGIFS